MITRIEKDRSCGEAYENSLMGKSSISNQHHRPIRVPPFTTWHAGCLLPPHFLGNRISPTSPSDSPSRVHPGSDDVTVISFLYLLINFLLRKEGVSSNKNKKEPYTVHCTHTKGVWAPLESKNKWGGGSRWRGHVGATWPLLCDRFGRRGSGQTLSPLLMGPTTLIYLFQKLT